jgi:TolB-like protein/Tfp pilus assembly protein PilF
LIRAALDRLTDDERLRMSDRNRRFLRFVVDEKLSGRAERIKSYTIAVDVFGRADDFDGAADPIVRIEATRLRSALASYYEGPGARETVRIVLPKGGYVPEFIIQNPAPDCTHRVQEASSPSPRWTKSHRWVYGAAGAAFIAGIALLFAVWTPQFPLPLRAFQDASPVVIVEPVVSVTDGPESQAIATGLSQSIVSGLSRFSGLRLVYARPGEAIGDQSAASAVYAVSASVRVSGNLLRFWWSVADRRTGEILWSENVDRERDQSFSEPIEDDVARRIAARVSEPEGVVRAREQIAAALRTTHGYTCVLRARAVQGAPYTAADLAVRRCLEQTVAFTPEYADAWALLALIYLKERQPPRRSSPAMDLSGMAYEAAQRATSLAPESGLAQMALLVALYRRGEFFQAQAAGARALELNPNDPEILAAVGIRKFARGDWDEGADLVRRSMETGTRVRPSAYMALALDAYRREDYTEALSLLSKIETDLPLRDVIMAATHAALGQNEAARAEIDAVLKIRPAYGRELRGELQSLHFVDALSELVVDGARRAGLAVS